MINRANELLQMIQAEIVCPPATQDISINLTNRKICVDKANYGPANPELLNDDFWKQKSDLFSTTPDIAKTMRCGNCAAFVIKSKMRDCIEKGLASVDISEEQNALDIIALADLGFCELFDFKCAGARTCDAWIAGGPLTK